MSRTSESFKATADAAQVMAGVIAARHRRDLAGANTLLDSLDDGARAAGCLFLAELAVALLSRYQERPADEIAASISLQIAERLPGP
jgi:Zn-dependent protease with chaperone function